MIIVTTLVIPPGGDAGPFDLYSDSDGYTVPFATNVSAAALQAGYSSTVPNDATIIRVVSIGVCTNFIYLNINALTTTTTTSSSSTSTSTSTSTTSTSSSTTTTTTAIPLLCFQAEVYPPIFNPGTFHTVQYLDCNGNVQIVNVPDGGTMVTICYTGIVSDNNNGYTNPLFTYCFEPPPTNPLSGTWDLDSVNANVNITSINNLSGDPVSCVGATLCTFPIVSGGGQYVATPPTSDGTTPISTTTTATLVLNLSWISVIPGATYYFTIDVTGQSLVTQFVTYGTPVVTLNVAGLITGSEDVNILFTGTF